MSKKSFTVRLYLPAQGSAESEATLLEWLVSEGDAFEKGQVLARAESAKSSFDFEAPCGGKVVKHLCEADDTVGFDEAVLEVETDDESMKEWIPTAYDAPSESGTDQAVEEALASAPRTRMSYTGRVIINGVGGYLPERVVTNADLVAGFDDISSDYVFQVTGISERRWATEDERPSDLAEKAARRAIADAGIESDEIDAVVLSTTTPDVAMPSTACILQERLGLRPGPAFDLNAACSGWLYALSMARGMIATGQSETVLVVGVDLQSRLLDSEDRDTYFLFGDGAGAAVVSSGGSGGVIHDLVIGADAKGRQLARREESGYFITNGAGPQGEKSGDPWIRLDGRALFRFAAGAFSQMIRDVIEQTGWRAEDVKWLIPHQANERILKAAAKRSGVEFNKFYINMDRVGNTSSASIPLALIEVKDGLVSGDKMVFCSVGAGITTGAMTVEWG